MRAYRRNSITLYATTEFLKWVKEIDPKLHRWDLETINNRPSLYLIEVEDQNCHGLAVRKYFKKIIESELCDHFYIDKEHWPKEISYELFEQWFTFKYHEGVIDLYDGKL